MTTLSVSSLLLNGANIFSTLVQGSDGLLFVVDSSDPVRFQEAKQELLNILLHEDFTPACPVVVSWLNYVLFKAPMMISL